MPVNYNSDEILISVLGSASFLLEHYGYSGHDPSLSELQRSLGRAIAQLEAQAPADYSPKRIERRKPRA
jgi:hypothetical protein